MKKITLLATLVVSAVFVSSQSIASNCFSESPNFSQTNEDYFELSEKKFDWPRDKAGERNKIYKAISGRKEGSYSETECFGSDKNPKPKVRQADLIVRIADNTNNRIDLSAELHFVEERKKELESVQLLDERYLTDVSINGTTLIGTEKYRKRNAANYSQLFERITTIQAEKSGYSIHIETYVNGYFAYERKFTLK